MSKYLDAPLQRQADRLGRAIGDPPPLWRPTSAMPSRLRRAALFVLAAGAAIALWGAFVPSDTVGDQPIGAATPHAAPRMSAGPAMTERPSPAIRPVLATAGRTEAAAPSSEEERSLVESAAERGETNTIAFETTPTQ